MANPDQARDKVGKWTKAGAAARVAAGVQTEEDRLSMRSGAVPEIRSGAENGNILKQIRQGDLVDFGDKGKYYVQGWRGDYFMVTKKSSERWVEDPIKWNLQGAIHFSDAKRVIRAD